MMLLPECQKRVTICAFLFDTLVRQTDRVSEYAHIVEIYTHAHAHT